MNNTHLIIFLYFALMMIQWILHMTVEKMLTGVYLCLPLFTCGYLWLQMEKSAVGEGRTLPAGSPVLGLSWPTTIVRASGTCWGPSVGAPVPSCSAWSVMWTTSRSSSSLIVSHQLKSLNALTIIHKHKSYKH